MVAPPSYKCIGYMAHGKRCDRNKIKGSDICQRCIDGKSSGLIGRASTDSNAYMKDWQNRKLNALKLPHWTPFDQEMKQKIWNYKPGHCFDTGEKLDAKGKANGDHIFGIRERAKDGKTGIDLLWNMIQCTQHVNTHWKTEDVPGGKNLVYDTFTDEEIKKFPEKVLERYNKFTEWKKHCSNRGVNSLYIEIPPEMNDNLIKIILKWKKGMAEELDEADERGWSSLLIS